MTDCDDGRPGEVAVPVQAAPMDAAPELAGVRSTEPELAGVQPEECDRS